MKLPKDFSPSFLYYLIISEYGEMESLWKDSESFHMMCSMYWERNTPVIDKLSETTEYEYNPLDDHDYDTTRVAAGNTIRDFRGDVINDRSAFNQTGYSPVTKANDTNNTTGHWDDSYKISRNGLNRYTYQQLIEQQRKVVDFHVEDYILRTWAKEMMVAIW